MRSSNYVSASFSISKADLIFSSATLPSLSLSIAAYDSRLGIYATFDELFCCFDLSFFL